MKRLLFSMWLIATAGAALAQGIIAFPAQHGNNSIVRTVDGQYSLIYNEPRGTDGCFILYDGNTALSVELPAGMRVHDVEVFQSRMAYFGGELGGRGVIGRFDIMATFFGSAAIDYYVTSATFTGDDVCLNCDMTVTNIKRIAVFDTMSYTVVAAIAEGYISYIDGPAARTTVMSAFFSGGYCSCNVGYNKDGYMDYTDIDCTEDYVVAVGTDSSQTRCLLKAFLRDCFFPTVPALSSGSDRIVYQAPAGPSKVAALGDNKVAVAQFNDKPGTNVHFFELNTVSGRPTAFSPSITTTPLSSIAYPTGEWEMNEVRYSHKTNQLYILEWMNHPYYSGFDSWLLSVDVPSPTSILAIHLNPKKQHSIDTTLVGLPTSVGATASGVLGLYPQINLTSRPSNCQSAELLGTMSAMPTIVGDGADCTEMPNWIGACISYTPNVERLSFRTECR